MVLSLQVQRMSQQNESNLIKTEASESAAEKIF